MKIPFGRLVGQILAILELINSELLKFAILRKIFKGCKLILLICPRINSVDLIFCHLEYWFK